MINTLIFDMDGVLVNAREIHYEALNKALKKIDERYVITRDEHLTIYDGLPTNKKLDILSEQKGFPLELKQMVEKYKQEFTFEAIDELLTYDEQKCEMLKKLSQEGYKIYVASNSIRKTVINMLTWISGHRLHSWRFLRMLSRLRPC